jgi:hypothetical protein
MKTSLFVAAHLGPALNTRRESRHLDCVIQDSVRM